jgi:large subunit ribosomal protein L29
MNKRNQPFKDLTKQELMAKADELRRELFSLRLHTSTSPVKDTTHFRKLKKDIARVLTQLHMHQRAQTA